jgi:hypothetical protein
MISVPKKRDERQQCDEGVIPDSPDPIEEERAPIPSIDLRRNIVPIDRRAGFHHHRFSAVPNWRFARTKRYKTNQVLCILDGGRQLPHI